METLLVSPKDSQELQLITTLFEKMKIKSRVLSAEEREDIGLGELMKTIDRSKKVSKESIIEKLK